MLMRAWAHLHTGSGSVRALNEALTKLGLTLVVR